MSYILNIDTATKNCSVAISKNGQTRVCLEIATEGYSHAEKLHVFIEEALEKISITYSDLAAVAVSKGPGSYTGLRIGVSAAKGLCYALDIPMISIDTLTVLASKVTKTDGLIIPMIDARRMEVYNAIFDSENKMTRAVTAEIITEDSFAEISDKIYIVGDCQDKIKTVLTRDTVVFLEEIIYPSAAEMGVLSFKKWQAREFEDVAYFEPFYLKDFLISSPKKQ